MTYRLILRNTPGTADYNPAASNFNTGANYPTCTRGTPDGCDPKDFDTIDAAVAYAAAHGETPVTVQTADEAWLIVSGKAVDPSQVLPLPTSTITYALYAVGAYLAYKFFR